MRKIATLGALIIIAATPATATARWRLVQAPRTAVAQPACPVGMPVQTITVINDAHVRAPALSTVERAVVDQSLQLRAWWATPCVRFGPGGWPLTLVIGSPDGAHGAHYPSHGLVWTAGGHWPSWAYAFSHEVAEYLEDPANQTAVWYNGAEFNVEIADPVETHTYPLDGVNVTDFVLPSYYAGGMLTVTCQDACVFTDPLAGSDAGAPYDYLRILSGPWQFVNDPPSET